MPPIVPDSLERPVESDPQKILVYLPWEDPEKMSEELRSVNTHQFFVYHPSFDSAVDADNLYIVLSARLLETNLRIIARAMDEAKTDEGIAD